MMTRRRKKEIADTNQVAQTVEKKDINLKSDMTRIKSHNKNKKTAVLSERWGFIMS